MMVTKKLSKQLKELHSIVPLIVFRIVFGCIMCFSQLRFIYKGWVVDCFILPEFHFTYNFFYWIPVFGIQTMYVFVACSAFFAFCIALGLFYRFSAISFFVIFTYLELIEKSWYLNHYYFVSLLAFLLIWLPANKNLSVDSFFVKKIRQIQVPYWTIAILQFQIAVVFFFGGIAKLTSDWLLEAQPLKIWLKARNSIPFLGNFFNYDFTPYFFSWSGMLYDLAIPFLLWNKKSRPVAYLLVLIFHLLTHLLFNIGMFPWLMIAVSLIFVSQKEWEVLLGKRTFEKLLLPISQNNFNISKNVLTYKLLVVYAAIQLILPLRHYFLTNNVLWTENGFRFAWHVMVMEKNGLCEFEVVDNNTNKKIKVKPQVYLTDIQYKQMTTQPDMIWQFAQYLKNKFPKSNPKDLSVFVKSRVTLNGRLSQVFINPDVNLLSLTKMDDIYSYVSSLEN